MISKLNTKKITHRTFSSHTMIPLEDTTIDDIFNKMCIVSTHEKFMNSFLHISFLDKDLTNVGASMKLFFLIPFYYKLTTTNIVKNKRIDLKATGGWLDGTLSIIFVETKKAVKITFEFNLRGINQFTHFYYYTFVQPNHEWYMRWRFNTFKKIVKQS